MAAVGRPQLGRVLVVVKKTRYEVERRALQRRLGLSTPPSDLQLAEELAARGSALPPMLSRHDVRRRCAVSL